MRCRSTGWATAFTSSLVTWNRPSRMARPSRRQSGTARPRARPPTDELLDEIRRGRVIRPGRPHEVAGIHEHVLATGTFRTTPGAPESGPGQPASVPALRRRSSASGSGALPRPSVFDDDVEHEPVELSFRERIRSLLLDGVLRGQNEKTAREAGRYLSRPSHGVPAWLRAARPESSAACD